MKNADTQEKSTDYAKDEVKYSTWATVVDTSAALCVHL